jgi:Endonuclease-reverse transcriptase
LYFVYNDKVSVATVTIPIAYSHVEIIAVDILNCPTKTRLFECYRPPSHDNDPDAKAYIADLCTCIKLLTPADATIVISGDFNSPTVDWDNIDYDSSGIDICSGIF